MNIHCRGQSHRDSVSNTSSATMINGPEGCHTQQPEKQFVGTQLSSLHRTALG